ncbi:unnamed protein product [Amoebophrya sp. A120]|nr:unnamed protein product [Amoebophrya sp. A120]|eukprot:GSA120T00002014001.1
MTDIVSSALSSIFDPEAPGADFVDDYRQREDQQVSVRNLPTWADLARREDEAKSDDNAIGAEELENPFQVDVRPCKRIKLYQVLHDVQRRTIKRLVVVAHAFSSCRFLDHYFFYHTQCADESTLQQGDICSLDAHALTLDVSYAFPPTDSPRNSPSRNKYNQDAGSQSHIVDDRSTAYGGSSSSASSSSSSGGNNFYGNHPLAPSNANAVYNYGGGAGAGGAPPAPPVIIQNAQQYYIGDEDDANSATRSTSNQNQPSGRFQSGGSHPSDFSPLGNPEARENPCSLLPVAGVRNVLKEYHHVMSLHSGSQMLSTLVSEDSIDFFGHTDGFETQNQIYGNPHGGGGGYHHGDGGTSSFGGPGRTLSRNWNPRDVGHTILVNSADGDTTLTQPSKLLRGGEVVHMKGNFGNLLCRKLLLFSGPRYTVKYKKAARHTWHVCVREMLKMADELKLKSIAIPICYSVRKNYPLKESVHILLRTVRRWLDLLPNNIEDVILVSPFSDHIELTKQLLKVYFPRFPKEGSLILFQELNAWIGLENLQNDEDSLHQNDDPSLAPAAERTSGVQAPPLDPQQRARERHMLLQAQFFGDPKTGEYIENRSGTKSHDHLKKMVRKRQDKEDDARTTRGKVRNASKNDGTPQNQRDDRSDDGELIEAFVGDWDHVAQRRLSLTMWEAETALECSRIYFRSLRHCGDMQSKQLDFLVDHSQNHVPHLWFLGDKIPARFAEEELLRYFTSRIEPFREMATPAPGRLVQECFLVYAHATGQYLPASRQFFGEIVRTVEYILPGMQFLIVHPTMAVKALFAFWYATGIISSDFWNRLVYCDTVAEVRQYLRDRGEAVPRSVEEFDAFFNSANYYFAETANG